MRQKQLRCRETRWEGSWSQSNEPASSRGLAGMEYSTGCAVAGDNFAGSVDEDQLGLGAATVHADFVGIGNNYGR